MTVLAYICLIAGAWQLAGCVMRLVDRLEGRGVKKTCRWHVFSPDRGGYAAAASIRDRKTYQRRADVGIGPYERKRGAK